MLGSLVVEELARRGHAVRALSRRAPGRPVAGAEHRAVDLTTGAGLREALAGADAVVDAANRNDRRAAAVLVEGTKRLVESAAAEGAGHIVEISIVGIDDVPLSYYKVKLEQERAIQQGDVPWSIVRATQFHQLLDWVFGSAARCGVVPSGRFPVAPVDPRVVARVLADTVESGPGGRVAEVGGPRSEPLADLARTWMTSTSGRRHAVRVALPMRRRMRASLAAGGLVPVDGAIVDGPSFAEWLRVRPAATAGASALARTAG
ncbi:MAG: hypothetical protein QOF69_3318 [Solirubrobacteraceae bacterium]|nr:hypothetical protein [Solirubrobacteraceae bacterium]